MTEILALRSSPTWPQHIKLIQVIPGTVIGPSLLYTSPAEAKGHMDRFTLSLLFAPQPVARFCFGTVSVRDCADVHVAALDPAKFSDESLDKVKFLVAAASTPKDSVGKVKPAQQIWKDVAMRLRKAFEKDAENDTFRISDQIPENMPFEVQSVWTENRVWDGQRKFTDFGTSVEEVGKWYLTLLKNESDADQGRK
jgi:hypothetical protein